MDWKGLFRSQVGEGKGSYEGSYSEALNYFDQSIEYDGIKNLVAPVETLVHKYLSQSELGLPINIEHLKALIEGFEKNNQSWYENEPEHINWALYELFGDEKYIIEAKNKIDSNLKRKLCQVKLFFTYFAVERPRSF